MMQSLSCFASLRASTLALRCCSRDRTRSARAAAVRWAFAHRGWVRVQAGKAVDRKGQPLTIKLTGPVEAWYEDLGENPPVAKKG